MTDVTLQPLGITADQRAKERSIVFGLVSDIAILLCFAAVIVIGGSFTLLAESIRAWLMVAIEAFALIALRRIHRGQLSSLEFGYGKLEQLANLAIAGGMLFGAAWIVLGSLELASGYKQVGTPFGLALAASINAVNTLINLLVWDAMRRAARASPSVIMEAQLAARQVKLLSSLVVQSTMTVAALCLDPGVAAWAEVAGSLFVALIIYLNAVAMIRQSLPDLLDRTADHDTRAAIGRVLAAHDAAYHRLERVRSRRSGNTVFVEIALAFPDELTVGEADRRIAALRDDLQAAVTGAEVAILIGAAQRA